MSKTTTPMKIWCEVAREEGDPLVRARFSVFELVWVLHQLGVIPVRISISFDRTTYAKRHFTQV